MNFIIATKKVSTKEVNKTGGGSQFQPDSAEKIIVDSISGTVKMIGIKGIKETGKVKAKFMVMSITFCFSTFYFKLCLLLGTATKRQNMPKDGPKLKVQLFGKLQTQETQKVQSEDESDTLSEILCPNLVNETQEEPPVLHFYSDLRTVPDTSNSTMSSLLKG